MSSFSIITLLFELRMKYFLLWVVLLLLVWSWPDVAQYLAVDRCLDAGGSFDYKKNLCDLPSSQ